MHNTSYLFMENKWICNNNTNKIPYYIITHKQISLLIVIILQSWMRIFEMLNLLITWYTYYNYLVRKRKMVTFIMKAMWRVKLRAMSPVPPLEVGGKIQAISFRPTTWGWWEECDDNSLVVCRHALQTFCLYVALIKLAFG